VLFLPETGRFPLNLRHRIRLDKLSHKSLQLNVLHKILLHIEWDKMAQKPIRTPQAIKKQPK
jgi:hypothetical protein